MIPNVLDPQEAAVIAQRQIIALNLESWRPEVEQWLHSAEAEPALLRLLAAAPCVGGVH